MANGVGRREPLEQDRADHGADRHLDTELLRAREDDPLARHYRDDVRVCFRTLLASAEPLAGDAAARAARRALFWIRRDAHFVSLGGGAFAAWRRFGATRPEAPDGVATVRTRLDYVGASPSP